MEAMCAKRKQRKTEWGRGSPHARAVSRPAYTQRACDAVTDSASRCRSASDAPFSHFQSLCCEVLQLFARQKLQFAREIVAKDYAPVFMIFDSIYKRETFFFLKKGERKEDSPTSKYASRRTRNQQLRQSSSCGITAEHEFGHDLRGNKKGEVGADVLYILWTCSI